MRFLIRTHCVERSADSKLDLERRPAYFGAKLAYAQLYGLKRPQDWRLRDFELVDNRDATLKELRAAGYYFDGFWYERPVSPERYYKKVHFDEKSCPIATEVARQIVNLPVYYDKKDLVDAWAIINKHSIKEARE